MERVGGFVRAHPALTVGTGATILSLSLGLGVATDQWIRARRAEQQVLTTTQRVIDDLVSSISMTRMGTQARRRTLEHIGPGIEALLAGSPGSAEVRATVARYYIQLGQLLGAPGTPHQNDPAGAERALRRAIGVAGRGEPARFETEAEAWSAAEAACLLADLLPERDRADECEALLRAVIGWSEEWASRSADPLRWRWRQCAAARILGRVMASSPRMAERERLARQADGWAAAACAAPPSSDPQMHCGDGFFLAGVVWLELGRPAEALERFARARVEYESRQGEDRPIEELFDLGDVHRFQGLCRDRLGDSEEAARLLGEALSIYQRAEALSPERSDGRGVRAHTLGLRAIVHARAGDPRAIDDLAEALAIRDQRMAEEDGKGFALPTLGMTLSHGEEAMGLLLGRDELSADVIARARAMRDEIEARRADMARRLAETGAGP
jgi:tetratricopeptide (TPR) repeat protein